MDPSLILSAAAGGAVGSIARYLVAISAGRLLGVEFPWGTLFINATGGFLIGMLAECFALGWDVSQATRVFLIVGICGGYTTFSTFSLDVVSLLDRQQVLPAAGYATASVILSIISLYAALRTVRAILV